MPITGKKEQLKTFEKYLRKEGHADNTIISYCWTLNFYMDHYNSFSVHDLLKFKHYMDSNYCPQTANIRILAMNKYLKSVGRKGVNLKTVKIQQRYFVENVISNADYEFFKRRLRRAKILKYYYLIWLVATTGARASEVVCFKIEHVKLGYMDITSKGRRFRRLLIPTRVQGSIMRWVSSEGRDSGYLFLNNLGEQISPRGISKQLKIYGKKFGLDTRVIYCHSFRHLFAKNFLEKCGDLVLLSDILGHASIDTTRIYTRRSSTEQRQLIEKIVTW